MKKNSSLAFLNKLFVFLLLIPSFFSACAGQMSLEEARQVTISVGDKSLTAPPRRIDDILSVLDQSTRQDPASSQKRRAEINTHPPQTDNPAQLAVYYHRKGDALMQIGRYSQALMDLRLAMTYSSQTGGNDPRLLFSLAYTEFASGNFKHAIELMERSLRLKERPSTYKGLVKLYARVGDLESAQRAANQGISLCNRLRNREGWGNWPVIHAAGMKAMVLEAQGKFAEAEPYYRQAIRNWTPSMRQQHPFSYIIDKIYLTRNLKNQDRLVEAEVEARDTLKAMDAIDRETGIFGHGVGELGIILLRQGHLQDSEKLMHACLRTLEEANVPVDSYLMADARMRLGEVLTAGQKFDEAMQQFDLARSGMQQNEYLYENVFARNPALLMALMRTGRIEEARKRISVVHAQNHKLLGEKHYLTAEVLGFRGMMHALQKNDKQALQDFSDAGAILFDSGGADTFSYGKKIRRKIIAESYLGLLAKVQGTDLEKTAGIDATSEAFKLADALRGSTVRGAIGASTTRAAVTSEELADLVRKEQDAQKQLKLLETTLTENLAASQDQQLPEVIKELQIRIDTLTKAFAGFGDPFFNQQQLAEVQKKKEEQAIQVASQQGQLHVRGIRVSDEGTLDSDKIVSCTLDSLNRLADTSAEIKHIAKALGADPASDVFLGLQASEQQVKSMDLSDRKVIAFATHALVPGDLDGLDQPALALSSPSIVGDNEDGLLTMGEILRLKLNADWVVLSACNTGAAEGKGAEAISGLGKAFFYAGTRAILVSMWPVETTSARELTTELFRFQQEDKNLSRARALQKSVLALIDEPGLKDQARGKIVASYAHPLFWAPFIVVGESGHHTN